MYKILTRTEKEEWESNNLSKRACKSNDIKYKARRLRNEELDLYRTEFQRDVSRILYSNPFRRLRTKNQVIYRDLDVHNRTRLTHTYEVTHLSRQLARALRLNEDLVEAIALGHDLGHTPFGHAGERALNNCMIDKGGFSHNAQSLWLVRKVFHNKKIEGENIFGLNLTYATEEGILKHTEVSTNIDEYKMFNPEKPGTLEAQVVNICDTLAYMNHDIDDGLRNKIFTKEELEKLWNEMADDNFDNWYFLFIHDLVNNSFDKDVISYSDEIEDIRKKLKKYVSSRLFTNPDIKEADKIAEEKVTEMFFLLAENPHLIPDSTSNKIKTNTYGIERTIIDYIQWLGDNNFDTVLNNIKRKI